MASGKYFDEIELTIVSRRLYRVKKEEWDSPEDQFLRVQGSALSSLLTAANGPSHVRDVCLRVLLLFDCMLRVMGEPVLDSQIAFATERFKSLQSLFYGALGSELFINVSRATRITWAHTFHKLLERLGDETPVKFSDHIQTYNSEIPPELVMGFEGTELNNSEVKRLSPFLLTPKSGVDYNVPLAPLPPVLGDAFTKSFHDGLRAIAAPKAKDTALPDFGATFARFIRYQASNRNAPTVNQLLDPAFVQIWIVNFMEYHFMKMVRRETPVQEGTLPSLQKLWSRYQNYWKSLANKGVVAEPANAFPGGNPKLLAGTEVAHRKMVPESDGTTTLVTQKLIVPVPLHITDEAATLLVFKHLKTAFDTVQSWLRDHLDAFFSDYDRGVELANTVKSQTPDEEFNKLGYKKRKEPRGVALAVKYFKSAHGGYTDTSRVRTPIYPTLAARDGPPKELVSRYLGLPSRCDAMALMAFLASQDGRFSESSLSAATLLDANGNRINAVETDAGLTLTVLKERDSGGGWHHVVLKQDVADYVRRWIQLTTPLRNYMKDNDIPGWHNLFIYLGNPLGPTGLFDRASNISSWFRQFANSHKSRLGPLSNQITIARIRSARGVLVFLDTMDLASMARELGNDSETSLRHYLPDSLWEYFATRWLRIFQNLLIVEATKGTPYMQRALHFHSAAEMDEFLQNHAFAPLLPEDQPPAEQTDTHRNVSEVMVAASPGLFGTLLSLAAATDSAEEAGRQLTGEAVYWTEFTMRLKKYIESDAFHDRGIKRMMVDAAQNIDPSNFEEIVCV
ncbi:hypothetical protein LMG28614_04105 [Paraburkholderia ultramafica]|uniref:Uncharacterized protein n=1 Tax=Paraburkholderia ultramafica TaxID=1544867 RepID=A0A6S7BC20_9BURK|nr:hypothetical protein [Paraburkholderia ultramafica]CAB3795173.1 hypothetical protein LMG28614_04105 [Paraburkholderia ultramafica]